MCHNFFGWEILEIILKNPIFSTFLGLLNLFLELKTIIGNRVGYLRGPVSNKLELEFGFCREKFQKMADFDLIFSGNFV